MGYECLVFMMKSTEAENKQTKEIKIRYKYFVFAEFHGNILNFMLSFYFMHALWELPVIFFRFSSCHGNIVIYANFFILRMRDKITCCIFPCFEFPWENCILQFMLNFFYFMHAQQDCMHVIFFYVFFNSHGNTLTALFSC